MLRTAAFLILCLASFGFAETPPLTITSAASNSPDLAAGSFASAFGTNLTHNAGIGSVPWPTNLAGVTVRVIDSGNVSRDAGIQFVTPGQINFQIPDGTALGLAGVFINNGVDTFSTLVPIRPVAPALFSIGVTNIAAATGIRTVLPTQIQSPVQIFTCLDTPASCHLVPIALGIDTPIFLSFYGTGIRNRARLDNVVVKIGSVSVGAMYAGPQPEFPGLDQVNIGLPLSLRGAGVVDVTVTVDGVTSNAVRISIE